MKETANKSSVVKIKFILASLTVFLLFGLHKPALAADADYKFCTISGFYMGSKEEFLGGLALNRMGKQNLFGNSVCAAVYKDAYAAGEYMSRTGKLRNASDQEMLDTVNAFKSKVQDAILKQAGY